MSRFKSTLHTQTSDFETDSFCLYSRVDSYSGLSMSSGWNDVYVPAQYCPPPRSVVPLPSCLHKTGRHLLRRQPSFTSSATSVSSPSRTSRSSSMLRCCTLLTRKLLQYITVICFSCTCKIVCFFLYTFAA